MECFICRISGEKARLFDAVDEKEGVIKICESCSYRESIPVINKPTDFQLKEAGRRQTVYERMVHISGVNGNKKPILRKSTELVKQEMSLKDIIEKKFMDRAQKREKKPDIDLVNNFNWVVMMARKSRKMTREQLADAIGEPEVIIKLSEQGIIPDNPKVISKLESYLKIRLFRSEIVEEPEKEKPKSLSFDQETIRQLSVKDLKELNKKIEDGDVPEELELDFDEEDEEYEEE